MANKIVQLVDKNSNNLYPVAGFVKDDAVSTGAISSQAVTTAKIANGAVTGVANDATAIGTAKLALDTVGTPNLRDQSVTSDKIDWTAFDYQFSTIPGAENVSVANSWTPQLKGPVVTFNVKPGGRYIIRAYCTYWGLNSSTNGQTISFGYAIDSGGAPGYCLHQILSGSSVKAPGEHTWQFTADRDTVTVQIVFYARAAATADYGTHNIMIYRIG